jgi:hypothetical protein
LAIHGHRRDPPRPLDPSAALGQHRIDGGLRHAPFADEWFLRGKRRVESVT